MNCLVTGIDGFIGTHLAKALTDAGHNVFGVDLKRGSAIDDIHGAFDWVFHLAAVSRTPPSIDNPVHCFETNVMGSVRVLEAARQMKAKRVVMASSNVVLAAHNPYWASKHAMELAAEAYRMTYGLSVICLRFSNVTGPGYPKGDLACVAALRDSLADKGYVEITGDGEQSRDFSHVKDVCRAMILAAASRYTGDALDICTGRNTSMNRVVDIMEETLDRPIERRYILERRGDCRHIYQDVEPAYRAIAYRAEFTSEEAIRDAVRS